MSTVYLLYLHSNMSLFKYDELVEIFLEEQYIYIPICLYLNTERRKILCSNREIYIPICLYLNKKRHNKSDFEVQFTFQYVSI